MGNAGEHATPVTIFGRTYNLRGGDPRHVTELAREVDRRMREVAESTGTADSLKIAILAALNIADENLKVRGSTPSRVDGDALDRVVRLLEEALDETGGRPEPHPGERAE